MIFILPANDWAAIIKDILVDSTWGKSRVNKIWTKIFFSETHIQWFSWFCYVLIISLDHKNVRFSHLFQMCSKSISNDIIRFSPFCSNENMRFSYILIILSECNKSRWSLHILQNDNITISWDFFQANCTNICSDHLLLLHSDNIIRM